MEREDGETDVETWTCHTTVENTTNVPHKFLCRALSLSLSLSLLCSNYIKSHHCLILFFVLKKKLPSQRESQARLNVNADKSKGF